MVVIKAGPIEIGCRKRATESPTTLRWHTLLCLGMRACNQERSA